MATDRLAGITALHGHASPDGPTTAPCPSGAKNTERRANCAVRRSWHAATNYENLNSFQMLLLLLLGLQQLNLAFRRQLRISRSTARHRLNVVTH